MLVSTTAAVWANGECTSGVQPGFCGGLGILAARDRRAGGAQRSWVTSYVKKDDVHRRVCACIHSLSDQQLGLFILLSRLPACLPACPYHRESSQSITRATSPEIHRNTACCEHPIPRTTIGWTLSQPPPPPPFPSRTHHHHLPSFEPHNASTRPARRSALHLHLPFREAGHNASRQPPISRSLGV